MNEHYFQESYRLHIRHTKELFQMVPSLLEDENLIDSWRHRRMYDCLKPIVLSFPNSSWLTIGDTGADAYYLSKIGCRNVTATNITDYQLQYLKKMGMISNINVKILNAENIDLADNSFDFVLCKESFHHFPRPPIAFYEMLRVCRQALVLIEPKEIDRKRFFDFLKQIIKIIMRRKKGFEHLFEQSGNFIFRVSESELIKMVTALQERYVATKKMNDFYFERIARKTTNRLIPMTIQKLAILVQDLFCRIKLMNYGLIVIAVFKNQVSSNVSSELLKGGFKIYRLPRNPYTIRHVAGRR